MNQKSQTIRLIELMDGEDGWGHQEGTRVGAKLKTLVAANPATVVFRISLTGVRRTDASFPRESVIEVARNYRKTKGFCLTDVIDEDLLDNWDAAAIKKEQPLVVWMDNKMRLIGPTLTEGLRLLFEEVVRQESTSVSTVASSLGINISNASNQLRKLWETGYLLRYEQSAPSGGIEFLYAVAK